MFQTTASKILDLVENASSRKSRQENFITRFARVYTPAVCYAALALAILPPLYLLLSGGQPEWSNWIMRALTFLVISCPCALVISIPLTFFAGIGGASREGVLVKGSNFFEDLARTSTVVMDKTGTMTCGVFEVAGVHHASLPEEEILEYAALAEMHIGHYAYPAAIGKCIVAHPAYLLDGGILYYLCVAYRRIDLTLYIKHSITLSTYQTSVCYAVIREYLSADRVFNMNS